jgi:hypothetical protein
MQTLEASVVCLAMKTVLPTGAERATNSAAMAPLAPTLLSTTIDWPSASENFFAD